LFARFQNSACQVNGYAHAQQSPYSMLYFFIV
jgi:hypothetical protein